MLNEQICARCANWNRVSTTSMTNNEKVGILLPRVTTDDRTRYWTELDTDCQPQLMETVQDSQDQWIQRFIVLCMARNIHFATKRLNTASMIHWSFSLTCSCLSTIGEWASLFFTRSFSLVSKSPIALSATQHPKHWTNFHHSLRLPFSSATFSSCPPFSGPVVGLIVSFGVQLSSQSSPFLQVLSSIAFTILLARLHGYLTISGVGTSLMEFSLVQCGRLSWLC